jgi:predicted dehydrogenase
MDYTRQPLIFRARKALRYVQLYGVGRTLVKVRGRLHMQRRYASLPPSHPERDSRAHVGFLGCGNFAYSTLAYYLRKNYGRVIRAAMDMDVHRAASLAEAYDADYYGDSADALLGDPRIDLIVIASFHSSHASYAVRALDAGKHVHIEKPHAVNFTQLEALCSAMERSSGRVNLGFNRPFAPMSLAIRERLAAQHGPLVASWFVLGHEMPRDHWYQRPEEGGRILGNFCHWSDFLLHLVPEAERYPITIRPLRASSPDTDLCVSYRFGDGSVASVAFAESKGHAFEGVRESFTAARGDCFAWIQDFARGAVDEGPRRLRLSRFFRDHGHEATLRRSYELARGGNPGLSPRTVWQTGELMLRTQEALEADREISLDARAGERFRATPT